VYADTSRINSTLRPWLCRFTYTYAFQPSQHPRSLSLFSHAHPPRRPAVICLPVLQGCSSAFAMARQVGNVSSWMSSGKISGHPRCRGDVSPIVVLFLTCSINCRVPRLFRSRGRRTWISDASVIVVCVNPDSIGELILEDLSIYFSIDKFLLKISHMIPPMRINEKINSE